MIIATNEILFCWPLEIFFLINQRFFLTSKAIKERGSPIPSKLIQKNLFVFFVCSQNEHKTEPC